MSWILFSFLAAIIWSVLEIMDKFVVDHEIDDFFVDSGINGFSLHLTMILSALIFGTISFSIKIVLIGGLIGFLYSLSTLFYYKGMKAEEVSRFIPTVSVNTIFIVIFSFFLIGESFNLLTYLGIVLTVGGAFLISLEDPLESLSQIHSERGFLLGIFVALLFGIREVSFKFFVADLSFWNLIFWMSIGGFVSSILLLFMKKEKVQDHEAVKHLSFIGLLAGIAFVLFAKAISNGPVSLSSTVTRIQPMLVLLGSFILTKYHPEIISEETDRKTVIQKIIAVILTVVGLLIVTLY